MDFIINNIMVVLLAVVSGGMLLFSFIVQGKKADVVVDVSRATQLMNREHAVLVDVRELDKYQAGHVPQSRHIEMSDIEAKASKLPKNKPIIVMCNMGRTSLQAVKQLKALGLENVYSLDGGIAAWIKAGLPIKK